MKCRENTEVIASFIHLILMLEQKKSNITELQSPRSPFASPQPSPREEAKETVDEAGE